MSTLLLFLWYLVVQCILGFTQSPGIQITKSTAAMLVYTTKECNYNMAAMTSHANQELWGYSCFLVLSTNLCTRYKRSDRFECEDQHTLGLHNKTSTMAVSPRASWVQRQHPPQCPLWSVSHRHLSVSWPPVESPARSLQIQPLAGSLFLVHLVECHQIWWTHCLQLLWVQQLDWNPFRFAVLHGQRKVESVLGSL